MKCHYCSATTDLRPYGPRGAMVCFSCAMASPDRKRQAEQSFVSQLNAVDGVAVIDGSEAGPYPLKHHLQAQAAYDAITREPTHE